MNRLCDFMVCVVLYAGLMRACMAGIYKEAVPGMWLKMQDCGINQAHAALFAAQLQPKSASSALPSWKCLSADVVMPLVKSSASMITAFPGHLSLPPYQTCTTCL